MPTLDNYTRTIYAAPECAEAGAGSPMELDEMIAMEAAVVRRRKDGSLMPRDRRAARAMASMMLKTVLDDEELDRIELTDSLDRTSGPSADHWKPARYVIRIPTDRPDPDLPVTIEYIVSAMLSATRDALAARRYLSKSMPSPADPFSDEADSIRLVSRLAENTRRTTRVPNFGLGEFDLQAVILGVERSRVLDHALPKFSDYPEDYESHLVKLDTARAMLERQSSRPFRIPVRKPEDGFLKDKAVLARKDLPGVSARMAAYIDPAPEAVTCIMNNPQRLDRLEKGYEITMDCTPDDRPASEAELLDAVLTPFRMAMSYAAGRAIDGNFPDPATVTQPELDWLRKIRSEPDDAGMIRDGIEFFAMLHAMAAAMQDAWAVGYGLAGRLSDLLAIQGWPDVDQWAESMLELIMTPSADPDPSPLADAYIQESIDVQVQGMEIRDQPLWQPPSLPFFPDEPCIRNCDLPDLAVQVVLSSLEGSFAAGALGLVQVRRNHPMSGATATKARTSMAALPSTGKPTDAGFRRDPVPDRGIALEPASCADIFQAAFSAAQAARRVEQGALRYGFAAPDPKETALLNVMTLPEGDARNMKLDMDSRIWALRKASGYFKAHGECLDVYGFDYESAAAAWCNLVKRNAGLPGRDADAAEDAARLLEELDRLS